MRGNKFIIPILGVLNKLCSQQKLTNVNIKNEAIKP